MGFLIVRIIVPKYQMIHKQTVITILMEMPVIIVLLLLMKIKEIRMVME